MDSICTVILTYKVKVTRLASEVQTVLQQPEISTLKSLLTTPEKTGKSLDESIAQLFNLLSQEDERESLDKIWKDQVE